MMPMTPSGTRTRSMVMPFGRVQDSVTVPTGSLSARTASMPAAMASTRASSSVSRSRKAPVTPAVRASARSSALAARIRAFCARTAAAMQVQGAVLLRRRGQRQHPGGRTGIAADLAHGFAMDGRYRRFPRCFSAARSWSQSPSDPHIGVVFLTRRGSGRRGRPGRRRLYGYCLGIAWISRHRSQPIT